MAPRELALWLPSALLLLQAPGSFPLRGPSTVTGTEGRSLSVQCQYEEQFQANSKYWCRKSLLLLCEKIVETTDSQRAVRSGRVSISDHPENLTFTVTLERLSLEDAGIYRCGVDTPSLEGFDPTVQVMVSVLPDSHRAEGQGSRSRDLQRRRPVLAADAGDICAAEMAPRELALWLPSALLLLQAPGSFPLRGPSTVTGTEGRSLSVQCQYEEQFQANSKYWCRKSLLLLCEKIVETTDSQRAVRSGRVSISDHPENLTFTVTLERLSLEDAGIYRCGVDTPWHKEFDPIVPVMVSVLPAWTFRSVTPTHGPAPPTGPTARTTPSTGLSPSPSPSPQPRSLLSSVRVLLLLFLELPLLLLMLSAVLWVSRPLRRLG